MKTFVSAILIAFLFYSCHSSQKMTTSTTETKLTENDTVRIANDDLEYEIIIFDPGFSTWLRSTARPEGYYSLDFLENRNYQYVIAWNQRVLQPQVYNPNLYAMQINYESNIDYGYEVNYKLYNYFIYFQLTYRQQLTGYIPRI
ncbi:DUF6146 family protein [Mangrovimonas sp. YM274]|uniref:DUF6146 family protein n=1 Tax=Mangrovimonas sp. YM274 TaxID=3070660 RepID=UPI0027DB51B4|nr:DUF6146 family protein [Mangrovimonas sp. YM274]WMI67239.1 DUF6146 family protein [Mangrovimonas sp. YM274]